MRNDYKGPPNRPLLRLSRFGGGGVFYLPANSRGPATAVHPNGQTQPFLRSLQGTYQREGTLVTKAIPIEHVRGDERGFGFSDSVYDPPVGTGRGPGGLRAGMFANRGRHRCPHCGR
jgi:hypothetical protein